MEHMDFATGKLTVTDNIYNQILLSISNETYKAGEKLPSESALCKTYRASRISVRSALQRLEAIGLIETQQGRGSYVKGMKTVDGARRSDPTESIEILPDRTLPMDAYQEFWQFRQPLADKAVELFVLRAGEEDFAVLSQYVDQMIDADSFESLTQLTVDFHMYIYQHCGNRLIANAFMENAEILTAAFRTIQKKHHQSKATLVRWHERILDLLRKADTRAISLTISEENIQFIHGVGNSDEQE